MKEEHKKKVRKSVLNSKSQLEDDLSKQLKQYGIFPDRLVDVEKLDLTGEKKEKRKDLEEILEKIEHKDTGDKTEQEYYVRKAAYTYFNRLAALKLMESHSLLDNVITPNSEFGNQPELLFHYKDITDIQNEDTLYESYFTGIFDDLDQEIGKIFDMDDQTSLLFPSSNAVDTVIEELDNIPQEAWKEEEIIGWMYQYFISEEKDDAFDKLNNDNQKINGSTLPAVTSLYTPHWIVEYLVDNTLGVMWKEMHPDTEIEKICDYIVPDQEFEEREPKDIEEITLLDPACGSGHFLLYAFDVFYEMYKEEGYDEEEIPQKILENNLYGIDVDNRSSQLSALALYVKAKELTPDAEISQLNIISADAVLMNGEKKEKLLEKCRHDIEEEVIEEIWDNFQHLDERGSLVKIEEPVREKITEYKNNLSKEDKDQQLIHQFSDETRELQSSSGQQKLAESVSTEEYWDIIEEQMIQKVQELGQEAIQAQDMSEQLFATETEKTLHLLDYLIADYDIVVANPPYQSKGNLNERYQDFLKENYPDSYKDLYSAFIERCNLFSSEDGFVGMISQDTFMFLSSFSKLRENVLSSGRMNSNLHLGTKAFPEIQGEKVRTSAYTIRKGVTGGESYFYRLVNSNSKREDFERILDNSNSDQKFQVNEDKFNRIPKSPLIYWLGDDLLGIVSSAQKFNDYFYVREGIHTSDNEKFLRFWWELEQNKPNWKPYSKGGEDSFYLTTKESLNWKDDGKLLKETEGSVVPSEEFYFREGITFSGVSGGRFSGCYMPEGYLFDRAGSSIFPKESESVKYALGYVNSKLFSFILDAFIPTVNFNVGYVKRMPYIKPEDDVKNEITENVDRAITNRKEFSNSIEINRHFKKPLIVQENVKKESLVDSAKSAIDYREGLEVKYQDILYSIDNSIYDLFDIESEVKEQIDKEIGLNPSEYSLKEPYLGFEDPERESSFKRQKSRFGEETKLKEFYLEGKEIPWGENRTRTKDMGIIDIARDLEVHPRTILESRKQAEIYRDKELEEEIKRLLSYFIQVSLGRWEMEGVEPADDGILMVSTEVSSDSPSLMDKIRECIAAEWGQENVSDIESEINNILYHGMEKWIKKYFFKNFHYKMYNKRPVVWEIKTPNDHFKAFIYYHELDEDTLPKLQVDYIEPLMTEYNNKKNLAKKNDNTAEAEKLEDKVEDLRKLKEQLDEVIEEGYSPDLDEGVKHNFKPIENMTSKEMK